MLALACDYYQILPSWMGFQEVALVSVDGWFGSLWK